MSFNCLSLKISQQDRSQKFWKIIHETFLPYVIKVMSSVAYLEFSQDHLQILLRHKPLNCISYKCSFCGKGYVQPYGLEVGCWRYFICLICGKWEAKQISQTKGSKKDTILAVWNGIYRNEGRNKPVYDLWLDKHEPMLNQSRKTPIIDLGCGYGNDALYLNERGFKTISCDFSNAALMRMKNFIAEPNTVQLNMLDNLPFKTGVAKLLIADLSLHYFSWLETKQVVFESSRILCDDGHILCRVNSTNDHNHGAGEGVPLEKNYYNVNGKLKRFFDKSLLEELFQNWEITYIQETELDRFAKKKILWELAARKKG